MDRSKAKWARETSERRPKRIAESTLSEFGRKKRPKVERRVKRRPNSDAN